MKTARKTARPGMTAGQVSGLTGMSEQMIERYVRRWPGAFKRDAKQPRAGRRYLREDVMALLRINFMMSHHHAALIPMMLAGNPPADLPHLDLYDLVTVYARVDAARREVKQLIAEADRIRGLQKITQTKIERDLRDVTARMNPFADRLRKLEEAVEDIQHPRSQAARKRKLLGIFDLAPKERQEPYAGVGVDKPRRRP